MHHSDLENLTTGPEPSDLSKLVRILEQPLDLRSPMDNLFLWDTLEKIPFISSTIQHFDNKNQLLQEIGALLKIETYPAQSVIRHFGDSVDRVHLVLRGQVRRYVPRSHEDIRNEQLATSGEASPFKFRQKIYTNTIQSPSEENMSPITIRNRTRNPSVVTMETAESPLKLKEAGQSVKTRARNGSQVFGEAVVESPTVKIKENVSLKTRGRNGSIVMTENEGSLQRRGSMGAVTSQVGITEAGSPGGNVEENEAAEQKKLVFDFVEEDVKVYSIVTPEEVEFFKRLAQPKKYFSGNMFQFRMEKSHEPGEFLGQIATVFNAPQGATLVAWEEVVLAYLSKEVYERVFKMNIGETKEKVKFFRETLLQGYSSKACTNLAYGFQKQVNRKEDMVFRENSEAEGLWVIAEGEVELYKILEAKESKERPPDSSPLRPKKHKALIIRLFKGQFLGEESILGGEERGFTAIVKSSHAVLYYLDNRRLGQIGQYQRESFDILLKKAEVCMDLKVKRLNKAVKETDIILNMPRMKLDDKNTEAKAKAKEAIDMIVGGVKVLEEEAQEENFNFKTVVKAEKIAQGKAQVEYLEKMAVLKKKIVSSDNKIDMKLLHQAPSAASKSIFQPEMPLKDIPKPTVYQLSEMERPNPRFYYPESFYDYVRSKDKTYVQRKKALERKLNLAHAEREKNIHRSKDKSDTSRGSISNTHRSSVREFIQRRLSIPIPMTLNTASQPSNSKREVTDGTGAEETSPGLMELCSPVKLMQRPSHESIFGANRFVNNNNTPDVGPIIRIPSEEKYASESFRYRLSRCDSPIRGDSPISIRTPEPIAITAATMMSLTKTTSVTTKASNKQHRLNSKSLSKLRINVVRDKIESMRKVTLGDNEQEKQQQPESVTFPFPFISGGDVKRSKKKRIRSIEAGSIDPWSNSSKSPTLIDLDAKPKEVLTSPLISAKKMAKDKMHIDLDEILKDGDLIVPQEDSPIRVLNVLKVMTDRGVIGDSLLPAIKGYKGGAETYRRSNIRGRTLQLFDVKMNVNEERFGGGSVRNVIKGKATRLSEDGTHGFSNRNLAGRRLPSLEKNNNMTVGPVIGMKPEEFGLEVRKSITYKKSSIVL